MAGLSYTTTQQNWRRIAHIIADAIYKRITGEKGYFDTRIVYVAETGPARTRIKRLAIMDQDGANDRNLTDGRALVLTPRFSPTAQEITYLSYAGKTPRVYLLNIDTGQQEVVGDFPGMSFAPRFSPNGNRVILSRAINGASNIFVYDLRTHQATRLTNSNSIDTSPCYSPDGSQIVFNSDRGGSQQLYVMNADGGGIRRISFGVGPVWHAGVVAARRPDRLYQDRGRLVLYRGHASGRFGGAAVDPGVSGRGADLGAQRPGADVFQPGPVRFARLRRFAAPANNRLDRIQPPCRAYSRRRVGPGVVSLAVSSARRILSTPFRGDFTRCGSNSSAWPDCCCCSPLAAPRRRRPALRGGPGGPGGPGGIAPGAAVPGSQQDLAQTAGDRVFFEFNQSDISSQAQQILERQASWLQHYPNVTVTIEGHCDERGTREYNLALGERRADAVKNVLVAAGIPASRIATISYGKERPIVPGSNEEAGREPRRHHHS